LLWGLVVIVKITKWEAHGEVDAICVILGNGILDRFFFPRWLQNRRIADPPTFG